MERNIDVCLTPELVHLNDLTGKIVVVVDIFRATSCMVAGLASGLDHIVPVASIEECLGYRESGYICAGERNGKKVPDFDIGNSPFEYMDADLKGRKVCTSTTNGTLAIQKSQAAAEIVIGSFLNLTTTVNYLRSSELDIVIHCAGWKGSFNLEDTTYAGALLSHLSDCTSFKSDAAFMAIQLWETANSDLYGFLLKSAHAKRLQKFGIEKDLSFSCEIDQFDVLTVMNNEKIVVS